MLWCHAVIVWLRPTGDAPILKQQKFKVSCPTQLHLTVKPIIQGSAQNTLTHLYLSADLGNREVLQDCRHPEEEGKSRSSGALGFLPL